MRCDKHSLKVTWSNNDPPHIFRKEPGKKVWSPAEWRKSPGPGSVKFKPGTLQDDKRRDEAPKNSLFCRVLHRSVWIIFQAANRYHESIFLFRFRTAFSNLREKRKPTWVQINEPRPATREVPRATNDATGLAWSLTRILHPRTTWCRSPQWVYTHRRMNPPTANYRKTRLARYQATFGREQNPLQYTVLRKVA
jgi:hypothetical protein